MNCIVYSKYTQTLPHWGYIKEVFSMFKLGFRVFTFLTLLIMLASPLVFSGDSWETKINENGIIIQTRDDPESSMNEFKAETTIDAPIEVVSMVLKDISNHKKWMDSYVESKIVKQLSDSSYEIYIKAHAPWPVTDRDEYAKIVFDDNVKEGGKLTVTISAIKEGYPKTKCVRVTYHTSKWILTKSSKDNNKTEVLFTVKQHPGGSIPDFLANSGVTNTPKKTLLNLKKYVAAQIKK